MSSGNKFYIIILALFCSLLFVRLSAQPKRYSNRMEQPVNRTVMTDSTVRTAARSSQTSGRLLPDTLRSGSDSLITDSLRVDSIPPKKKNPLDAVVDYSAKDSIVFTGGNTAYMYGDGVVKYQDIELQANEITMNMDSSIVYAVGRPDSVGEMQGSPVFKDKSGEYESKTMRYNFKSKKGFITNIVTQQGEGYLTGGKTKKMENNEYFMQNGRYTTCDLHDHPHFYMQLTQAKLRPKKNIVTGPAYMVLADVPLPLAVPFGFFPFTQKYSSGIIVPTFGDEMARGFYLRDGGYYFAISDYMDLALMGEIYTKGSWGVNAQSQYIKRYKYSGNFNLSFITTITGDKGMPDYSKQKNFRVAWTHTQDAKANPNMSFSASVNFTTSGYTRNDLNSQFSNSFTENTKSSSVNMTYRFPNSPFSISTTANITQRTQDSTVAVSFPNLTISMSQIYPFKRKNPVGNERWYEKIRLTYSGLFQNSIQTKQDLFFKSNLIKDWRNGMRHTASASATFNVFKYVNINPTISFNDRMYTSKTLQNYDPNLSRLVPVDTTYGFYNVYDFNAGVSMSTKIYGFFQPMKFLGDKVKMIRHVLTPSVSFTARPDFSSPGWGFYHRYSYIKDGQIFEGKYSPFSGNLYGTAPQGKQGMVSFSLDNNLEMKIKSDRDTTGERRISLIEKLSLSTSYNMAADSLKWSDLNTSILLRLTKNFNLNLSAIWDLYTYNDQGTRINKTRLQAGKGLARLRSTGTSFSYTFNNDTFKRKKKDDQSASVPSNPEFADEQQAGEEEPQNNKKEENKDDFSSDGYMKWNVPWSLSINYSINYGYGAFNKQKREYEGRITQNLSFSGNINLTKNWSFNFSSSYNFDTNRIAYMNCGITRDLHCWTMSASFIPVGPYKSYNFHISVKSSLLSDLKYDKHSSTYDRLQWY